MDVYNMSRKICRNLKLEMRKGTNMKLYKVMVLSVLIYGSKRYMGVWMFIHTTKYKQGTRPAEITFMKSTNAET